MSKKPDEIQKRKAPPGLLARTVALQPLQRAQPAEGEEAAADDRTVALAFSSELPCARWWGREVLSHEPGAMRMDRLAARAALLENHDMDRQIGVVESATLDADKIGRAVVRFSRSAAADAVYQDVKDGIRGHVSVAYMVHRWEVTEETDGTETWRAIDWEPYEISIVSVPFDPTVGVGRGMTDAQHETLARSFGLQLPAPEQTQTGERAAAADTAPAHDPARIDPQPKQPNQEQRNMSTKTADELAREATQAHARNAAQIIQLGGTFAKHGGQRIAQEFLAEGKSDPAEFQRHLFDKIGTSAADADPLAEIGMTQKEARRFSMLRAINALVNPQDKNAQAAAAFEREASDAVAQKLGRAAKGLFIPMEVQRRDLTVGTATAGGNTVATKLDAANMIELMRNRMMTRRLGARVLTGLVGQLAIPKQTGAGSAYWVSEAGAPTESQQTIGQVPMSPKTVGAYTDISRRLLLQSSISMDDFVQTDLGKVLGLAIDAAGIAGTGAANQPTGILSTAGIGSVAIGTNGGAVAWDHLTKLWAEVATDNADYAATGFLTNAKLVGKMLATEKAASTARYLVEQFPDAEGFTNLAGARCGVSNQVPSTLTKGTAVGVCSALIYGTWDSLVYGEWGALDIMVDPYSNSTSGTVRVVALQDVDVAVRLAEAFAAIVDATTT